MLARVIVVVVILGLVGAWTNFNPNKMSYERPTEDWVEEQVPTTVGNWQFLRGDQDPMQTYKMDEVTYDMLNPFGIVSRHFVNSQNQAIDAVVIASDDTDSFHDQRWCFTGQGWIIEKDVTEMVKTKTFGEIPMRVLTMRHPEKGSTTALFTFKGVGRKFHDNYNSMWRDFVMDSVRNQRPPWGSFYRFIALTPNTDVTTLKTFAAEYIDATDAKSKGKV